MIRFIRKFIADQRKTYKCLNKSCAYTTSQAGTYYPIHNIYVECLTSVDVHSTLRYFSGLFIEKKIFTEDEDFEDYRAYMQSNIKRFLNYHGNNHVRLSSLVV